MSKELELASKMDVDEYAELFAAHRQCLDNIEFWKKEAAKAAARIAALMGPDHTAALINGQEIFTFNYVDKMRVGDFKKEHPDLYEMYVRERTVTEFDIEGFKRARPDLYREYQSRAMRNTFEIQ